MSLSSACCTPSPETSRVIDGLSDFLEIDFREDGLQAVAERAMERKTGARGLRSILEGILLESMYTIPSTPDVAKLVVDESVVKGDSEPLLVYETPSAAAAGAEE